MVYQRKILQLSWLDFRSIFNWTWNRHISRLLTRKNIFLCEISGLKLSGLLGRLAGNLPIIQPYWLAINRLEYRQFLWRELVIDAKNCKFDLPISSAFQIFSSGGIDLTNWLKCNMHIKDGLIEMKTISPCFEVVQARDSS